MATVYTDIPHNYDEISPYTITDSETIAAKIFEKKKCYFYDTCSFRRHANLREEMVKYFLEYIKHQDGVVIITRCILMELASQSGILNQEYIDFIIKMKEFGIDVLIVYEEDLFDVMEGCFGTNAAINSYLVWAVRMLKGAVSTITEVLENDDDLKKEVINGRNIGDRDIFKRFFGAVRGNKEADDNLGEELLAICLHILSHLPGEPDGKFCVVTDDKGAAGKIDVLFRKTKEQFAGKRIIIFSTPKWVQIMYNEGILTDKEHINEILSSGSDGNIRVLGTKIYDLRSREISISCAELTDLIVRVNRIHITF